MMREDNAVQLIEVALDDVRDAIYSNGYPELDGLENQLMHAENVLMKMLADIEHGRELSDQGGLGHAVVDQWPLTSGVSEAVCAAVHEYERVRTRAT
jgi:hypothetical protein